MKTFLSSAIFVLSLACLKAAAQPLSGARNPESGYVLTLSNDTVRGTIDYLSDQENAVACHFCPEGESVFRVYSPDDIRGYRFLNDGVYYVSKTFPVDGKDKKMFVEFLLKGGVSLYRHANGEKTLLYLTDQNGKTAAIDAKTYESYRKEEIVQMKRSNLSDAALILARSQKAVKDLWEKETTAENLVDITRSYNEQFCAEEGDCVVFQYDKKGSALYHKSLRIEAGIGFCHVDNGNFGYNTEMPRLGIGGEFTSSRINPNLSFQLMLVGGIYEDKNFLGDDYKGQKRFWGELDAGPLYRLSANRRSTGFIRGGFSLSLPVGVYGGAGWEFSLGKQRLQVTATGYYQGIAISGGMTMGTIDVAIVL